MRARELLQESADYNNDLQSDLTNLLIGAKAAGATSLNTSQVAQQLHNMGYSVDVNSIMSLLSNNPAVLSATPQEIIITPPEGSVGAGDQAQDSADQVSDMAQAANPLG